MASQNVPTITYAFLTAQPDFTSCTIGLWLQMAFGPGYYTVGGVPAGLQALVSAVTIDINQFLACNVYSEADETASILSLPTVGGYTYRYIPATDRWQIFTNNNGAEFLASEAIPPGVLNDIIVVNPIYNRL